LGKEIAGIAPVAMQGLMRREWKGNVRELENVLEGAMAFSTGQMLTEADFDDAVSRVATPLVSIASSPEIPASGLDLDASILTLEKGLLLKALDAANGVQTEAAKRLHISFRSFRYRLQKYGIDSSNTGKD
jgi:two-component system response regulator PilR (NtrC family)